MLSLRAWATLYRLLQAVCLAAPEAAWQDLHLLARMACLHPIPWLRAQDRLVVMVHRGLAFPLAVNPVANPVMDVSSSILAGSCTNAIPIKI